MVELHGAVAALTAVLAGTGTPGATLSVLRDGEQLADIAIGTQADGRPLTTDRWVPWYSASKLPATITVACAWEQGLLEPHDLVVDHLPEFAGGGKDMIRIEHLLSHTAPLRGVDRVVGATLPDGREPLLARIYAADADPDWVPGHRAGYLGHAGYLLLDEIVCRGSGTTFAEFQRRHVLRPLGLRSDLGRPVDQDVLEVPWLGDPRLAARVAGHDVALGYPSACMAGPFRDAARLGEVLRQGGRVGRVELLRRDTCEALLQDRRAVDMVDESAGLPRRWGWGMALDQMNWAPASPKAFGALGGTACSVVADPETGVCVALYFVGNTMPDERVRRDQRVHQAIWRDLGIG